jgi:hypothetical protein
MIKIKNVRKKGRRAIQIPAASSRITDTVALSNGGFITFPKATVLSEVPAGVYYPGVDSRDQSFMLSKVNPELLGLTDHVSDLILDDLSLNTGVDTSRIHEEDVHQGDESEGEGYFPMEKHHAGLADAERNVQAFLAARSFYKERNLGYKRSLLFYGAPGTGKSRYIDNLGNRLIRDYDAVVLRVESPHELSALLNHGIPVLKKVLHNRMKVIIIEELVSLIDRNYSTEILNLLDHPFLKDDLLFLITTNNPENVPQNIVDRPSRVDLLVEVNTNGLQPGFVPAWYEFLMGSPIPDEVNTQLESTTELSPAYLKELFVSSHVCTQTTAHTLEELKIRRKKLKAEFKPGKEIGF